jgi:hypothetical protein
MVESNVLEVHMHAFDRIGSSPRLPSVASAAGWSAWVPVAVRALGAVTVLAVGGVHLHEYRGLYGRSQPIGTLFLLNVAGATTIGLGYWRQSSTCWACGRRGGRAARGGRCRSGRAVLRLGGFVVARHVGRTPARRW